MKAATAALIVGAAFVTLAIGALVFTSFTSTLNTSREVGCEGLLRDRTVVARLADSLHTYYGGVLAAPSVKQDVKTVAARVHRRAGQVASSLESRLYDCHTLIYDHRRVIDRRALRAATR